MANATPSTVREAQLLGQTVVLIGGSAGIGLETARQARAEGADVVLARPRPGAPRTRRRRRRRAEHAAFDAHDPEPPRRVLPVASGARRPRHGHRGRPVLRAAGRLDIAGAAATSPTRSG